MFKKIRNHIACTVWFLSYFVVYFLSKIFLSIEVHYEDKSFKDVKKPTIVVSNHENPFDPWIIFVSMPFWSYVKLLPVRPFAKNKFSEKRSFLGVLSSLRIINFIYFIYNVIIVSSDVSFEEKIKPIIDSIKENNTVLIFPEGKIILDTEVGEFKKGAVVIQERTGAPILPCAISHGKRGLFRKKVYVSFGKPFYISKELMDNKDDYAEAREDLRKKIKNLYQKSNF